MIRYTTGDIFQAKTEAIVNTVNLEGIMGKGLALRFKKEFPENFKAYAKAHKNGELAMGKMFIFHEQNLQGSKYIINFPTKNKWRNKSRLQDIELGLISLVQDVQNLNIKSIAIPPLGCGLGGLSWPNVKQKINDAFQNIDIDVVVYEPLDNDAPKTILNTKKAKLTESKAVILTLFKTYMNLVPTVAITLIEAHKLCYLLQASGIDLKLRFVPWKYGPYAQNLHHVFAEMENRWIQGFGDGKIRPFDTLSLLPEAYNTSLSPTYAQAIASLDNVYRGFESIVGLEFLATIHWLIAHEQVPQSSHEVKKSISQWLNNKDLWGTRKAELFKLYDIDQGIERIRILEKYKQTTIESN